MLRADPAAARRRALPLAWVQSGLLLVALATLLTGFHLVIQGWAWWLSATAVVTVTLLAAAVARSLRWPPLLVGFAVWLLALVYVFAPDTLVLGVVPTPASIGELWRTASEAGRVIVEEQAPVDAGGPIAFVLASSFGLVALVLDALLVSLSSALGVGIVLAAMYVCPAVIAGREPDMVVFVVAAALWLVLLRLQVAAPGGTPSWRHRLPGVAIGTGAIALSLVVPTALPQVSTLATGWGDPPTDAFARGVNPMLELGSNLRRGATVTSLEYTTTLGTAQYLRVATLSDFTGRTWRPSDRDRFGLDEGAAQIDAAVDQSAETTRIRIRDLASPRLPVTYPAVRVRGLDGTWQLDPQGLTVRSRTASSADQSYAVDTVEPAPTVQQLRAAPRQDGVGASRYLRLPPLPESISRTAREVTAGATNDYDRAVALQSYFRDGEFEYSETAPVADGYDGNGVRVIARFLQKKAGYCVHFASAMAVMARDLGIPARIVVGFAPGDSAGADGADRTIYQNTSDDLHSWPELYFQGVGWVRFEPTPGIGRATDYSAPDTQDAPADEGATPTPAAPTEAPRERTDQSLTADQDEAATQDSSSAAPALGGLLVLAALGAAPAALRAGRRRWRRRSHDTVLPAWDELQDTAYDLGRAVPPAATPREVAASLAVGPDRAALDRLLQAYERERFARPGEASGYDPVPDLDAVTAALRERAATGARLRAVLLPRSLAGRRGRLEERPPQPAG